MINWRVSLAVILLVLSASAPASVDATTLHKLLCDGRRSESFVNGESINEPFSTYNLAVDDSNALYQLDKNRQFARRLEEARDSAGGVMHCVTDDQETSCTLVGEDDLSQNYHYNFRTGSYQQDWSRDIGNSSHDIIDKGRCLRGGLIDVQVNQN